MKIIGVVKANRRRDRRVSSTRIRIEMDNHVYETLDWSLGGFLIGRYRGLRRPGEEVMVGISVSAAGQLYEHVARAEIVRVAAATGYLAASFTRLDSHAVDTLEAYQTGRLRRRRRRAG